MNDFRRRCDQQRTYICTTEINTSPCAFVFPFLYIFVWMYKIRIHYYEWILWCFKQTQRHYKKIVNRTTGLKKTISSWDHIMNWSDVDKVEILLLLFLVFFGNNNNNNNGKVYWVAEDIDVGPTVKNCVVHKVSRQTGHFWTFHRLPTFTKCHVQLSVQNCWFWCRKQLTNIISAVS